MSMDTIKKILELDRNDFFTFIDQRINDLEKCESICPAMHDYDLVKTNKFFGDSSKIITGSSPLVIDDKEIYCMLFENVKKFFNKEFKNENERIIALSKCVQKTVFDYIGIGRPDEVKRLIIFKTDNERDVDTSIKSFKNNFAGLCTERAAIAHNCFQMLGIESVFASEYIFLQGQKDLHAFNFFKYDGQVYLYDLINTYYMKDKEMPDTILKKIDKDMADEIFDNRESCDCQEIYSVKSTAQSGREYTIDYGYKEDEKYNF